MPFWLPSGYAHIEIISKKLLAVMNYQQKLQNIYNYKKGIGNLYSIFLLKAIAWSVNLWNLYIGLKSDFP